MADMNQGTFAGTVTIANGQAVSSSLALNNAHLVGIVLPAAWTAAGLTFQVSRDRGATFFDFYRDGAEYLRADAAASRDLGVNPADFAGVDAVRLRSGTSGAPVNQGADRSITLVTRRYT